MRPIYYYCSRHKPLFLQSCFGILRSHPLNGTDADRVVCVALFVPSHLTLNVSTAAAAQSTAQNVQTQRRPASIVSTSICKGALLMCSKRFEMRRHQICGARGYGAHRLVLIVVPSPQLQLIPFCHAYHLCPPLPEHSVPRCEAAPSLGQVTGV